MDRIEQKKRLIGEVKIPYKDVAEIWKVLDNLRVSIDGIFGHYSKDKEFLHKELEAYLTSGIWQEISDAAFSLYQYIEEEEIEKLCEEIKYWE